MEIREVADALQAARDQASRHHTRVRLPLLLVGGAMGALDVCIRLLAEEDGWGMVASRFFCSLASVALLLAVLPSDRWTPFAVTALKAALWAVVLSSQVWHLAALYAHGGKSTPSMLQLCEGFWGSAAPCILEAVSVPAFVSGLVLSSFMITYLMAGICKPPRLVIKRLRKATCSAFICTAAVYVAGLPAMAANAGRFAPTRGVIVADTLLVLFNATAASLLLWPKFRRHLLFCLQSRSGQVVAAATIAAFIGGRDPEEVVEQASRCCCYVSLDRVKEEDMLAPCPNPTLSKLATPCNLPDLDAFLSHSWHDPPKEKWQALQAWRSAFKAKHRREPRVWIDKYCIDQTCIQVSLMCLPVYLAGCQILLILAGPTYLTRLWCVEEVFIYLQMGRPPESIKLRLLSDQVEEDIERFRVEDAHCFLAEDESVLRATIEAGFCTFGAFDAQVRRALKLALAHV